MVNPGKDDYNLADLHNNKKQKLQKLKYLQKQEQQFQDLTVKNNLTFKQ